MKKNDGGRPEDQLVNDSPFDRLESEKVAAREPCCGPGVLNAIGTPDPETEPWTTGKIDSPVGPVCQISTTTTWRDRLSTWKVRWGINRMGYTVRPDVYAVGKPDKSSDIFVSANYKMSFDRLRENLKGVDGWILVIDTKGVNVWCAAGKGTFGTEELINRINVARLSELTDNRRLILPQLGAPGVTGFTVKERTGFRVKYGPVRASDLPEYLSSGKVATKEMRRVRFPFIERLALTPIEIVAPIKYTAIVALFFVLFGGFYPGGYSLENLMSFGPVAALFFILAFMAGSLLAPVLLPWLPGRSFSAKGAWAGLLVLIAVSLWYYSRSTLPDSLTGSLAWVFLIPAVASFVMMNFTGSSTYTSFSGVVKEMRIAVRIQAASGVIGLGLWIAGRFV